VYSFHNPDEARCPICMEALIMAPRITKCGHVYCWPCMLQYLAFENEKAWKKCPLCSEPVYRQDLRRVDLKVVRPFHAGNTINFNLMMRNKSHIIVKNLFHDS